MKIVFFTKICDIYKIAFPIRNPGSRYWVSTIENRIYREEFTVEKSVKRPFCCTVSICRCTSHIYAI